jgi:hypothetical protein
VGVCVPAGAVAFLAAAWLLRAPELGELLGAVRGRQPDDDTKPTATDL